MKEQSVGQKTVERSEYYAHGIDAIREEEPELADSILNAEKKVSKQSIQDIGKAEPEKKHEMIQAVKEGRPYKEPEEKPVIRKTPEERKQYKEEMKKVAEAVAELFDETEPIGYTVDSLLYDIKINSEPFIRLVRQMVERNKEICIENKETVIRTIHENIVSKIEEIEKEIEGYE